MHFGIRYVAVCENTKTAVSNGWFFCCWHCTQRSFQSISLSPLGFLCVCVWMYCRCLFHCVFFNYILCIYFYGWGKLEEGVCVWAMLLVSLDGYDIESTIDFCVFVFICFVVVFFIVFYVLFCIRVCVWAMLLVSLDGYNIQQVLLVMSSSDLVN